MLYYHYDSLLIISFLVHNWPSYIVITPWAPSKNSHLATFGGHAGPPDLRKVPGPASHQQNPDDTIPVGRDLNEHCEGKPGDSQWMARWICSELITSIKFNRWCNFREVSRSDIRSMARSPSKSAWLGRCAMGHLWSPVVNSEATIMDTCHKVRSLAGWSTSSQIVSLCLLANAMRSPCECKSVHFPCQKSVLSAPFFLAASP